MKLLLANNTDVSEISPETNNSRVSLGCNLRGSFTTLDWMASDYGGNLAIVNVSSVQCLIRSALIARLVSRAILDAVPLPKKTHNPLFLSLMGALISHGLVR